MRSGSLQRGRGSNYKYQTESGHPSRSSNQTGSAHASTISYNYDRYDDINSSNASLQSDNENRKMQKAVRSKARIKRTTSERENGAVLRQGKLGSMNEKIGDGGGFNDGNRKSGRKRKKEKSSARLAPLGQESQEENYVGQAVGGSVRSFGGKNTVSSGGDPKHGSTHPSGRNPGPQG